MSGLSCAKHVDSYNCICKCNQKQDVFYPPGIARENKSQTDKGHTHASDLPEIFLIKKTVVNTRYAQADQRISEICN